MRHLEYYSNPKIDAYAEALLTQNAGGVCPHCKSALGHYSYCPLLSRSVAEECSAQRAAEAENISKADAEHLHALGVRWE
jgi:hypothetical protein